MSFSHIPTASIGPMRHHQAGSRGILQQDLEMDAAARRRPADCAVRCPEGASGQCFFQKHATMGIATEHLHLVPEKGDKIISIDDLDGLIALVQAGVLEIHTRGTTIDDRERAERLVFDLDPGPGTHWKDVVAAAREVRERLSALKLKSFLKTSGGKGLHVVLPIRPAAMGCGERFRACYRRVDGGRLHPTVTWQRRPKTAAQTVFSSTICAIVAKQRRSRLTRPARALAHRCRRQSIGPNWRSLKAANQYYG